VKRNTEYTEFDFIYQARAFFRSGVYTHLIVCDLMRSKYEGHCPNFLRTCVKNRLSNGNPRFSVDLQLTLLKKGTRYAIIRPSGVLNDQHLSRRYHIDSVGRDDILSASSFVIQYLTMLIISCRCGIRTSCDGATRL
jgi:hypothetical protein